LGYAAVSVDGNQFRSHWQQAASLQASIKGIRVFAYPANVVH
jgi:hypothetical protein